jgi:hypothetical protein
VTDAKASRREGCVWHLLLGIQVAAVAAVLVAILVVWIIGHTDSNFVSR